MSILAYLCMVGGMVGLLATRNLFSPAPVVIIPQAAALLLMIWARVTFGRRSFHLAANPTESVLVITGPYRFIRHPIFQELVTRMRGIESGRKHAEGYIRHVQSPDFALPLA